MHVDVTIQRYTFTDVLTCEIQFVRYKMLQYYIQVYAFRWKVSISDISICFYVLIVNAGSTGNLCRGASCVQIDVLVIVAVVVDIVDGTRCLTYRERTCIFQIHGKVKVERGSAESIIFLQLADVDAVTTESTCQEMLLIVGEVIGGTSDAC